MPEFIEIEGELARIIDRRVVREVALADLITHIETRLPVTTPALPDRTRLFHLDPTNHDDWKLALLIELHPAVRTITLAPGRWNRTETIQPRLAMPWTVFSFHLRSLNQGRTWTFTDYDCFHSREALTGEPTQWMIPALLPNIYNNGKICFGNTAPTLRAEATLAERLNAIVNEFYLTEFTDHGVRARFIPWHGARTYTRWERETRANPRCWENWPEFEPDNQDYHHYTVQEILSEGGLTPRTQPIVLPDGIPDLVFAPTFGRAGEWFANLNATQQRRLAVAIDIYRAEHGLPTEPEPIVEATPDEDDEE